MKTCQRPLFNSKGEQIGTCGKQATHSAYTPPTFLCPDCLHDCMEDEGPIAQQSVEEIKE